MHTLLVVVELFVALAVLNLLVTAANKGIDLVAGFVAAHVRRPMLAARVDEASGFIGIAAVVGSGFVAWLWYSAAISLQVFLIGLSAAALLLVCAIVLARAPLIQRDLIIGREYQERQRADERFRREHPERAAALEADIQRERRRASEERNRKQRDVAYIKSLSGSDFERHVEKTYRRLGYWVQRVGGAGDQGVDHIMKKSGLKTAVQCKRYTGVVRNDAIQQVIAGMLYHECDYGIVVTTSTFSKSAQELAKKANVELVDGQAYMRLVESRVETSEAPKPDNSVPF